MNGRCGVVVGVLVALAGQAVAQTGLEELQAMHPGVRAAMDGERIRAVYGVPMSVGNTPGEAAAAWLAQHADAFGAGELEIEGTFVTPVRDGRFTAFGYQQFIDGIPVEYGQARVLVLEGDVDRVVYAAGTLAPRPEAGFDPVLVTSEDAMVIAQGQLGAVFLGLQEWSQPELVVWQGDGTEWVEPVLAWKVSGGAADVASEAVAQTFFISAFTGEVVHSRNEIFTLEDIDGTATGNGSSGTLPDIPANPESVFPMPNMVIGLAGDPAEGVTDVDGIFTIPFGGNGPVTVTSNTSDGLWVNINNNVGADETVSVEVTPPGPADLVFASDLAQFTVSQVNAFHHTSITHNYIKDRAPGFTPIDLAITSNVNASSLPCNAFYSTQGGHSINFMRELDGCVNSAYSTVVAHEYGHFIVNRLGLAQGAFGEGYSDTCSLLIYDTCILGEHFFLNGGNIRNPCTANQQYPCNGGSHTCGQVLGGTVIEMRFNLGDTYGSEPGLELARDLHVAWSMITTGGQGSNAAHPLTAIEYLTVDDDDGNLLNGSPNYDDICDAFDQHNVPCPEVSLLEITFAEGIPELIAPGADAVLEFEVAGISAEPEPGSALAFASIDGGELVQLSVDEIDTNVYTMTVPGLDCEQTVGFFVMAQTTDGDDVTSPADAPEDLHMPVVASASDDIVIEAFEVDSGWTVGDADDTATTGIWVRVNPVGTAAQPEDDHTVDGTDCFVTGQGQQGGGLGDNDVDNGKTTLFSPVYDLSGAGSAELSYFRWYSNNTGNAPNTDIFVIDISDDGGDTWTNLEVIGPAGEGTNGGWIEATFDVGSVVELTDSVMLRFVAEDDPTDGEGSLVEAAIDDLAVTSFECEACAADFNGDGELSILDFVAFQTAFVNGDDAADFNGDGELSILDFVAFQGAFQAGCD